jgi:hypothetical protein
MNSIDYDLKDLEIAVAGNDSRTVSPEVTERIAGICGLEYASCVCLACFADAFNAHRRDRCV